MTRWLRDEKLRFQPADRGTRGDLGGECGRRRSTGAAFVACLAQVARRLASQDRTDHALEQDLAEILVKTPYILLLSHPGINVVSAAELAGEMGPIEHYAHAQAITGRAGLFPSRYQSDEVDRADGPLAHLRNARLRAAWMRVADNSDQVQRALPRQV